MRNYVSRRTVLAGACSSVLAFTIAPPVSAAPKHVIVAVPNPSAITWIPLWVAIGQGFFRQENLEIQVEAVDGSAQVLQALAAGQAQIGTPGAAPTLAARERGLDVKFFYNIYPKSAFGLLVPTSSQLRVPTDLKGKTIGISTADGAEVGFVKSILSAENMQEGKDFHFLAVGDGGLAAVAFQRGEIDAYVGAVADMSILAARGLHLREITPEPFLAYFGNGFVATTAFINQNKDTIERFGRAIVRGMKFAADPANLAATLADAAAGNPMEGEDKQAAAALLKVAVDRMTPTSTFAPLGLGYMPPEHWQAWQKSQLKSGGLKAPLADLSSAYTNDFVSGWNK